MSRSNSDGQRRLDTGAVVPCGNGLFYTVSRGILGMLAPKSELLERRLVDIPGVTLVPGCDRTSNALLPAIHMAEVARLLRDPPPGPALAACRGRVW